MNVAIYYTHIAIYINYHYVITVEAFLEPNPKYNLCYCEDCLKSRKEEKTYKRGIPPKKYTLPIGWTRFSLRYVQAIAVAVVPL